MYQLYADPGCCQDNQPGVIDDRDRCKDIDILFFIEKRTSSDSEVLFSIKNEISKLLNPLSVLVYPLFHLFSSYI